MLPSIKGVYHNGEVILKEPPPSGIMMTEVVVTFLLPQPEESSTKGEGHDWQADWKAVSCWSEEDIAAIQWVREEFNQWLAPDV